MNFCKTLLLIACFPYWLSGQIKCENLSDFLITEKSQPIQYQLRGFANNFTYFFNDEQIVRTSFSPKGAFQTYLKLKNNIDFEFIDSARSGFKNEKFIKAVENKNNILGFSVGSNETNKDLKTLYCYVVSKKDGRITDHFELESNVTLKTNTLTEEDINYRIQVSPDKSKTVIYYRISRPDVNPKKSMDELFHFTILDSDMHQIWSKDVLIPFGYKDAFFKDLAIDNEGNINWLLKFPEGGTGLGFSDLYESSKFSSNKKSNFNLKMVSITENGTNVSATQINLNVGSVYTAEIRMVNNRNVLFGYYSDEGILNANGIFVAEIAVNGQLENVKSASFINEPTIKSTLYSYDLKDLFQNEDGSFMAFIEKHETIGISRGSYSSTGNSFYEAIAIELGTDNTNRFVKMNKHQYFEGNDPANSSIWATQRGNKYYIFTLDNVDNINKPETTKPAKFNGNREAGALFVYELDRENFKATRFPVTPISSITESPLSYLFFNQMLRISDDKILFELINARASVITVIMTFEE